MAQKRKPRRNYAKENSWEDTPEQVKRREARNKARRKATKRVGKSALKGKELDHVGYHRTGSLDKVPTRIVSRHANRIRQPPRGGNSPKRGGKRS